LRSASGKAYKINWQISKITKNEHSFVIAVGSNVTKFVQENRGLKKELNSIKVGFDYFPFAIGYMNAQGNFTKMNPRFMKMFHIAKNRLEISFDDVPLFKKYIGFKKMSESVKLLKEVHYKLNYKDLNIKVDVRLLKGKKESSKFYIVVVQRVK